MQVSLCSSVHINKFHCIAAGVKKHLDFNPILQGVPLGKTSYTLVENHEIMKSVRSL